MNFRRRRTALFSVVALIFEPHLKYKGDVLLEFSLVKWVLNEDHTLYSNLMGPLLLQNFALVNSYFNEFFVAQAVFDIIGIRFM